jgi:hypothetical protein
MKLSHSLALLALALAPALAHAQSTETASSEPTHAARVLTLSAAGPSPDSVPQPHGEAAPGFRIESQPNWQLVVAGAGTFLGTYAVALVAALTVESDSSPLCAASAPMGTVNSGSTPRPECFHNFQLAAIPIVGPFLVLPLRSGATPPSYGNLDPGWAAGLVVDAISQIAGLAMFIIGFIDEQRHSVRGSDHADLRLRVYGGPTGIGATLNF